MTLAINWGAGGDSSGGSTSGGGNVSNQNVTLGTGSGSPFASGDIICIVTVADQSSAVSTPSGFTKVQSANVCYFYRICDGTGSDPSSTTLNISGFSPSSYVAAAAWTITGGSGVDPSWTIWSHSLTAASISPASSGDILVGVLADYAPSNWATPTQGLPSGFTDPGHHIISQKTNGPASGREGSSVYPGYISTIASGSTGTELFSDNQAFNVYTVLLAFAGPTTISKTDSDSGTATDSEVLGTVSVASDSGSGADDAVPGVVVISLAAGMESAAGTESSNNPGSGAQPKSGADSGIGSGFQGSIRLAASDSGAGVGSDDSYLPAYNDLYGLPWVGVDSPADSGSGSGSGKPQLSASDSGAGSDSQIARALLGSLDSGIGSSSQQLAAAASSADSAAGSGMASILASTTSADGGNGSSTESIPGQLSRKQDSDAGTGTGSWLLAALNDSADSGAGSGLAVVWIESSDGGGGVSGASVQVLASAADDGAGDGTEQQPPMGSSDSASGGDGLGSIRALAAGAESVFGSETVILGTGGSDSASCSGWEVLTASAHDYASGSGSGTEAPPGLIDPLDAGSGLDSGIAGASTADSDTGTGTSAESFHLGGIFLVYGTDSGHAQEGDQEPASDADSASGTEAESVVYAIQAYDAGSGAGSSGLFAAVQHVGSLDSSAVADYGAVAGTGSVIRADSDTGTTADTGVAGYLPSDDEAASGVENGTYEIEVFPFPPPWLFRVPGGGETRYRLVFRPGTPHERVVREYSGELRFIIPAMREMYEKIRFSDTLLDVSSSDSGTVTAVSKPTGTVHQYATQARVTCAAGD